MTCFLLSHYKAFSRIAEVNLPAAARTLFCVAQSCKRENLKRACRLRPRRGKEVGDKYAEGEPVSPGGRESGDKCIDPSTLA